MTPADVVSFVPAGKIRCFVTKGLRKDTPEENVRQRWARSLVEEYGYALSDMAIEFRIKMGSGSKRADIVVFKPGGPRRQDTVALVVEAKRENVTPKGKSEGVDQLKSYMSACSACKFGLWVGVERLAYEKSDDGEINDTTDIPRFGDTQPQPPKFHELTPSIDLKASLRRCHNYIYANQGIQKAEAFHELQKLMFCKVLDENELVEQLRFFVRGEERRSIAGQRRLRDERIAPLFEEVKERYPYIFEPDERIKLNPKVLAYIVSELQRYSLLNTKTDVKGQAYEELVGANLRGDRGEFFTPRNVCDMAVRIVLSLHSNQKIASLKVLDCCCGTGGFLVAVVNQLRQKVAGFEQAKGGSPEDIRYRIGARVKGMAERNLFGMDINPFLVRTTQMNLVMHGDGSVNVFQGDSLVSPSEWEDEGARKKIKQGSFDIVVTNPPFGGQAHVDDPHTLSRYELPSLETKDIRQLMPAEQLFVEGALKYVKRGGYLAIVLPRSIANNPGLRFIRRWLVANTRIVASVDLPKETFAEGGGVPNPSVLIMQRLTREEIRLARAGALDEYEIFMSMPKKVGIDKRGNPVHVRTPEGLVVLDENNKPSVDDDLPKVVSDFEQWNGGEDRAMPETESYTLPSGFLAESDEIRLDAGRYNPRLIDAIRTMRESGRPLKRLADITKSVFIPPRFKRIYVEAEHGVPFLQGSHVVHFQPADLKYLSRSSRKLEQWIVRGGWILVTCSGTIGRAMVCPPEWDGWAASQHILRIVPDEKKCPTGYLCAFLSSPFGQAQLTANIYGAVVDELTEEQAGGILVPVPKTASDRALVQSINESMKEATRLKSQAVAATQTGVERTTTWLKETDTAIIHKGKDLRIPSATPEQLAKDLLSGGAKPRPETKTQKAS